MDKNKPAPELMPNDLVEVRLVGRIGESGQGPAGVHVIFSDSFGREQSLILKRQWLREVRADALPTNPSDFTPS